MLVKWVKKYFPDKTSLKDQPALRRVRNYLKHPNLWSINCASLARGVSIGLLVAFIPLPFQMLIAAVLSILFRAYLPIAIVLTWITNPLTFIPINFFVYQVGSRVMGKVNGFHMVVPDWHFNSLYEFWMSFKAWISHLSVTYLVGLPVVAISAAVIGYFAVLIFWRAGTLFINHRNKKIK